MKAQKIRMAVDSLNKAMSLEEPNIVIYIPGGFEKDRESDEFVAAIKTFVEVYKRFYGLDKVEVQFIL